MNRFILLGVLVAVGCAGGKKKKAEDASVVEPRLTDAGGGAVDAELMPFDEEQAEVVLKRGARKAENCAKVSNNPPRGEGEIEVVFDGPKGRVVKVILGNEFRSASEDGQSCLKNAFIGEIIPPFSGEKTVPYKIVLPDK